VHFYLWRKRADDFATKKTFEQKIMEPTDHSPTKKLVSRSMYLTYLVLLYLGLLLLIIGIPLLADGNEDESLPWIVMGVLLNIAGSILMLIMVYRFWDFVIRAMGASHLTPSIETPGKAIGYLFIPFYNFYWIFMTYGKLPKDLNALAASRNVEERLPEDTGTIIAALVVVGVIPYVGYVTSFISAFIMVPIFIRKIIRYIDNLPDTEAISGSVTGEGSIGSVSDLESIHDHTVFFNAKENGINFPAGIALFIGLVITHLLWMIGNHAFRPGFFSIFARYYLPLMFSDVFLVTAFLYTIHSIKKDITLFIAYGIALVLLGILKSYLFRFTLMGVQDMGGSVITFPRMISVFFYAVFFMAGLVYSIRYYGTKWWSISGGLACAFLAAYLVTELIGLTMGSGFYFRFRNLILSIVTYAIQGFSIWYGIRYFVLKKGMFAG
jgi:hypothetical protein